MLFGKSMEKWFTSGCMLKISNILSVPKKCAKAGLGGQKQISEGCVPKGLEISWCHPFPPSLLPGSFWRWSGKWSTWSSTNTYRGTGGRLNTLIREETGAVENISRTINDFDASIWTNPGGGGYRVGVGGCGRWGWSCVTKTWIAFVARGACRVYYPVL